MRKNAGNTIPSQQSKPEPRTSTRNSTPMFGPSHVLLSVQPPSHYHSSVSPFTSTYQVVLQTIIRNYITSQSTLSNTIRNLSDYLFHCLSHKLYLNIPFFSGYIPTSNRDVILYMVENGVLDIIRRVYQEDNNETDLVCDSLF